MKNFAITIFAQHSKFKIVSAALLYLRNKTDYNIFLTFGILKVHCVYGLCKSVLILNTVPFSALKIFLKHRRSSYKQEMMKAVPQGNTVKVSPPTPIKIALFHKKCVATGMKLKEKKILYTWQAWK